MFLDHSRNFARLLPVAEISSLPPPSQPDKVVAWGRMLIRVLQTHDTDVQTTITPDMAHWVVDEWLHSVDVDSLTTLQRAMCAFVLLEVFLSDPNVSRNPLSVTVTIKYLAPAVGLIGLRERTMIQLMVTELLADSVRLKLEDWEVQRLQVFSIMVGDVDMPSSKEQIMAATQALTTLWKDEIVEHRAEIAEIFECILPACSTPLRVALRRVMTRRAREQS